MADIGDDELNRPEAEEVTNVRFVQTGLALSRDNLARLIPHLRQRETNDPSNEASFRHGVSAVERVAAQPQHAAGRLTKAVETWTQEKSKAVERAVGCRGGFCGAASLPPPRSQSLDDMSNIA